MKRNSITSRLSLRAKFKDSHTVEVCVMNEYGEILIFMLPVDFEGTDLPVLKTRIKSTKPEEGQSNVEKEDKDD